MQKIQKRVLCFVFHEKFRTIVNEIRPEYLSSLYSAHHQFPVHLDNKNELIQQKWKRPPLEYDIFSQNGTLIWIAQPIDVKKDWL